jgi:hypothetical protein
MSNRGQTFIVEVRRKPNPDYQSKPGDARRAGRVDVLAGMSAIALDFAERANAIEARLGVVTVGAITHDTTSKGYFWAIYLPGMPSAPKPARDVDAARRAILHKVREWCEAAKLISTRRGR